MPSKKTPVKKSTAKRKTTPTRKRAVAAKRQEPPFMSWDLTDQTLYWLIFGVVVVGFGLWILKLQADVSAIYDQIDQNQTQLTEPVKPSKHR